MIRAKKIEDFFFAALLLCVAVLSVGATTQETPTLVPPKISGEIYFHQRMKVRPPHVSEPKHLRRVVELGLNEKNLDAEECVLYVKKQLTDEEIQELAASGIMVHPTIWVPPLPGRHPHGFHMATVPYVALDRLDRNDRFVKVMSAERRHKPLNDLGTLMIKVDHVQSGAVGPSRDGTGVNVAVADSGIDVTHPDLPTPVETFDMTDGTGPGSWGTNVANLVTNHGTHVSGSIVGDGTLSNDTYAGSAPGANFYFYKIANDTDGSSTDTDEIEAIQRAEAVGCDVFSMSYGGYSFFMDGSDAVSQAIDVAVTNGMIAFIAAGNAADDADHFSINVAPSTTTAPFGFAIDNSNNPNPFTSDITIRVIWIDNSTLDENITLACTNLAAGEALVEVASNISARGTEGKQYALTPNIPAWGANTYNLTLQNTAVVGATPLVHCYKGGFGTFNVPDPSGTIISPAIADLAIAVGAWTQRTEWTDFQGNSQDDPGNTVGTLANFSSLGPRIDGVRKPDIVAPGCWTISLLDSGILANPVDPSRIIDNDGLNLNGSGPADYAVSPGTSMACPLAAGVAALLLEEDPTLTPAEVRNALTSTASMATSPNNDVGFGLINALEAYRRVQVGAIWADFAYVGSQTGAFDEPYDTLTKALAAVPADGTIRVKPSSSAETLTINQSVIIDGFMGTATIGQ